MRKHLQRDFTAIYHFDLKGNVRKNPKLSGTQYNVFGIQVGVGISILVRHQRVPWSMAHGRLMEPAKYVSYAAVEADVPRLAKLAAIAKTGTLTKVKWAKLKPDDRGNWLLGKADDDFAELVPIGTKEGKASDKQKIGRRHISHVFARCVDQPRRSRLWLQRRRGVLTP